MKKKKNIFYGLFIVSAIAVGTIVGPSIKNSNILETSILTMFSNVLEYKNSVPPDLAIDKVYIKQLIEPTEKFNYYTYDLRVHLINNGGDLDGAKVMLDSDSDSNHLFIKNNGGGFSLGEGEEYIVRHYEVLFDARYNKGIVDLELRIDDQEIEDVNLDNNIYSFEVFHFPSNLKNIGIDSIQDDGSFIVNFDIEDYSFDDYEVEFFFSDQLKDEEIEGAYKEVYGQEKAYAYTVLENSIELINSGNWIKRPGVGENDFKVKVFNDPYISEETYYVYASAKNTITGDEKISDILKFSPMEKMNRAEFAQLFMEYFEIDIFDDGVIFYEDIPVDEWYAPAVQTVYNLGLTELDETIFNPNEIVTREEVLISVMEYSGADLTIAQEAYRFEDVEEENDLHPYVQALAGEEKGSELGEGFDQESPASRAFLKYLIMEYGNDS